MGEDVGSVRVLMDGKLVGETRLLAAEDIVWHQASVSGDTATFYVPSSAHKGESGAYTTHIYLYDNAGKLAPLKGVNVTVPSAVVTPPIPSSSFSIGDVSVTELSASGYRVTAKINALTTGVLLL